jgi:hypothetical protein
MLFSMVFFQREMTGIQCGPDDFESVDNFGLFLRDWFSRGLPRSIECFAYFVLIVFMETLVQ